jgi:hypothetical protein
VELFLAAAEAAGVSVADGRSVDRHAGRNVYFCWRERTSDMRDALVRHLGRRIAPQTAAPWGDIASAHEGVYRSVCHGTRAR